MAKTLEEILGKIERVPVLTGTREGEYEKVWYMNYTASRSPRNTFLEIFEMCDNLYPRNGGYFVDNWKLSTPDGDMFFALVFNKEYDTWKKWIEAVALQTGYLLGKIDGNKFIVSDGRVFDLNICTAEVIPGLSSGKNANP